MTALSDTGATLRFELEAAGPATVEVSLAATDQAPQANSASDGSASRPVRFESREPAAMHVVSMTGLRPATRYAYVVRAAGAVLADGHLATAPGPDANAPLTFLVYGDDRTDDAAHAAVVRAMSAVPSDFLVNTGDMVQDGASAPNWQTFFDIERALLRERALFSAIGNHELYDDVAGANFARYFGFSEGTGPSHPYGTVRVGNARFFFLNGMDDWSSGEEREWLQRELARADGEPGLVWRFAVVHHSPWSAGPHGPNQKFVQAGGPELLAAHKVDLLFAGHDHIYERGDAGVLKYVISGGGGAPLYRDIHATPTTRKVEATYHFIEVSTHGDAFQMVARRVDGSVLDRCGFRKGGPWDCDAATAPAAVSASPGLAPTASASASASPSAPRSPSSGGCACAAPGSSERRGDGGVAFAGLASLAGWQLIRGVRRRYASSRCALSRL